MIESVRWGRKRDSRCGTSPCCRVDTWKNGTIALPARRKRNEKYSRRPGLGKGAQNVVLKLQATAMTTWYGNTLL